MTVRVRRGTSVQWAASTKVLLLGEIGLDTTVNKIKFGNGTSLWSALPFVNVLPSEVQELAQDAAGLAILNGTHSHIQVAYNDAGDAINLSTAPEVVLNTGLQSQLGDYLTISAFESLKDEFDGIPTLTSTGFIRNEEIDSTIARVASPTFTGTVGGITKAMVGLDNVDNTADNNKPISNATQTALDAKAPLNSPTFTGTVILPTETISNADIHWEHYGLESDLPSATLKHGMFAHVHGTGAAYYAHSGSWYKLAKQTDVDLKAPLNSPTFTGTANVNDLTIGGTLTFNGTATTINSTNLSITDPLIYMGTGNSANAVDLGIVTHFNNGTYQHSGLVRDHNDGKWKLFSGITDEPSTTVNFAQAVYDTLKIGGLEITGTATGITKAMIGLGNVDNTSDQTKYLNEYITDSTTSRTISSTTDKFKLIEFTNSGAITVTIPNDTQDSGWPIGASLEIRQVGTGQITVGKDAAVTLNSPEDQRKTRVQWSSILLEKRAANTWLLTGDTTA